eukprot:414962-Pleurochrysis_carterae.AAC.2
MQYRYAVLKATRGRDGLPSRDDVFLSNTLGPLRYPGLASACFDEHLQAVFPAQSADRCPPQFRHLSLCQEASRPLLSSPPPQISVPVPVTGSSAAAARRSSLAAAPFRALPARRLVARGGTPARVSRRRLRPYEREGGVGGACRWEIVRSDEMLVHDWDGGGSCSEIAGSAVLLGGQKLSVAVAI